MLIGLDGTYLITIVCPWTEFHEACLLIKWKISHINFTWRFENRGGHPVNFPRIVQDGFCQCCHHIFAISAAKYMYQFKPNEKWEKWWIKNPEWPELVGFWLKFNKVEIKHWICSNDKYAVYIIHWSLMAENEFEIHIYKWFYLCNWITFILI